MPVNKLSVRGLLPDTDYYMTYDGSTTAPACFETVTWVIINKPIYITKQQVLSQHTITCSSHEAAKNIYLKNYEKFITWDTIPASPLSYNFGAISVGA